MSDEGIVATGGWCAPSNTVHPFFSEQSFEPIRKVTAERGGIAMSRTCLHIETEPVSDEVRAERAAQRARERAERKAAGGEWQYALREVEDDGEVTYHGGSSSYERGGEYASVEEVMAGEGWQIGMDLSATYDVVRRWVPDPGEWEQAVVEAQGGS